MTYKELYQSLFGAHVVSLFYLKPMQPSFPKWYDANAQCEYHAGITRHSIENCIAFKKLIERFIEMGIVQLDDPSRPNVAGNTLPSHSNKRVNTTIESGGKRTKIDVAKIKTLLRWVWKKLVEGRLIMQDLDERPEGMRNYCEFHVKKGHEIQEYIEFRALVQNLMDNKEIEFYEKVKGSEEGDIWALEERSKEKVHKVNHPVLIISRLRSNEVEVQIAPRVIIQKPVAFPYKDNKRVPWNYDCNVTILGEKNRVQDVGFCTRSGRRYDHTNTRVKPVKGKTSVVEQKKEKTTKLESHVNEPITEKEAKKFLKFLKHNEYSVPARISVLVLLSSETHRSALMKVLNETYVAEDIYVNKLDRLVLNITIRCKGYTLLGVLTDNGFALNVLPLSTLNRLSVDSSHMDTCQNIVRAFDGTERREMERIEIPFLVGPNTYEVDFLVMDIKPSYNCLLGRPWIHSAGVVPSSLHQKLKLVTEGRLVTINMEEDIIASVTNDAPYIGADDEAIECSFRLLEFVNSTFIVEGNKILMPKISKTMKMGLQLTIRKGALPDKGLKKYLQGRVEAPICEEKEEGVGEETRKKKNVTEWRRNQMETNDLSPYIQNIHKGGTIHPEQKMSRKETAEEMLGNLNINSISEEGIREENLSSICPYVPGSVPNNWTTKEIHAVSRCQ
ncbi:hypothetical protein EPI10_006821 [Gossypium australe]|uniref:Uncharacterized protein n=1 Tax=Gossypium australe TaxID=47621 RepID=A0A5B6WV23_9ROSI|nr:hypothetical protein EPI10_006821 [Gossypium australe]